MRLLYFVAVAVVVTALNLYGIHIRCTWKALGLHRLKILRIFGTRLHVKSSQTNTATTTTMTKAILAVVCFATTATTTAT